MEGRGISLAGLQTFLESRGGMAVFQQLTTTQAVALHILPSVRASGVSSGAYTAACPEDTGEPTVLVTHAHGGRFITLVHVLIAWELKRLALDAHAAPTFFYIDVFCAPQHPMPAQPRDAAWLQAYTSAIAALGHTLLVLDLGASGPPLALRRAWCLLELSATLRRSGGRVEVLVEPSDAAGFERALARSYSTAAAPLCTAPRVARAEATRPEDLSALRAALEAFPGGSDEAERLIEAALRSWCASCGVSALQRLGDKEARRGAIDLVSATAAALAEAGRAAEAEAWHGEAHEALAARAAGAATPVTPTVAAAAAGAAFALARDKQALGKLGEAEALLRASQKALTGLLGEDAPASLAASCALAGVLGDQGQLGRAEALLREVLAAHQRGGEGEGEGKGEGSGGQGGSQAEAASTQEALALLLQRQGDARALEEAGELLAQALAARRAASTDAPHTLTTAAALASVRAAQRRYSEAEALYRGVLESRRRLLGSEHSATLLAMYCLGVVLGSMNRGEEAEALFREELGVLRRVKGEGHSDTRASEANYAQMLQRLGREEGAAAAAAAARG